MPNGNASETPVPTPDTSEIRVESSPSDAPSATVERLEKFSGGFMRRAKVRLEKLYDAPEFISGRKRESRNIRGTEDAKRSRFVAEVDATALKALQLHEHFSAHPENLPKFINEELIGHTGEIPREKMVPGYMALKAEHQELELDIKNSQGRQSETVQEMADTQEWLNEIEKNRTPEEQARHRAWWEASFHLSNLPRIQEHNLQQQRRGEATEKYFDEIVIPELNGQREREKLNLIDPHAHPESVERSFQLIQQEIEEYERENEPLISKYRREGRETVDDAAVDQSLKREFGGVHEAKKDLDAQYERAIGKAGEGYLVKEARDIFEQEFRRHKAVSDEFENIFTATEARLSAAAGGPVPRNKVIEAMPDDVVGRHRSSTKEYKETLRALNLNFRDLRNPTEYNQLINDLQAISGSAKTLDVTRRGSAMEILNRIKDREESKIFQNEEQKEAYEQRRQELRTENTERKELSDMEIAQEIGGRYEELWQARESALYLQNIYENTDLSDAEHRRFRELISLANSTGGLTPGSPEATEYMALENRLRAFLARIGESLSTFGNLETDHETFIDGERRRLGRIIAVKETPEYQQIISQLDSENIRQSIRDNQPLEENPRFAELQRQVEQRVSDMETQEEKDMRTLREQYREEEEKIAVAREMQEVLEPVLGTLEVKIQNEYGEGFLRAVERRAKMLQRRMEQHRQLQAAIKGKNPGVGSVAEAAKNGLALSGELQNMTLEQLVNYLMDNFGMERERAISTAREYKNQLSLFSIILSVIANLSRLQRRARAA